MAYYIIVFVLLMVAELLYFKVAEKCNIIDNPNERSSHTTVTLRGGGIIFYFGVLAFFLASGGRHPWMMAALTLVSFVSFWDDVKSLSQGVRLFFQFVAMALMFVQWAMYCQPWLLVIVLLVACVGVINAFNFMDGINGITGGYSLVILLFMEYVNRTRIVFVEESFIDTMLCAVLVFCFFNFRNKAKCFAGDVGSVSIAFVLLYLLGRLVIKSHDLSWVVLMAVYGVDSVLTIVHRLILRENIAQPHRKHLYQLMANELKIPHVRVSAVYMIIQVIVSVGYLTIPVNGYLYLVVAVALLSIVYVCFMKKYYHLHQG